MHPCALPRPKPIGAPTSLVTSTPDASPHGVPKQAHLKKFPPFTALSGFKSSSFNGGAAFSNVPHHSPLFHLGAMVPAWWVFVLAGALAAIFTISPCDVLPLLPRRPTCSRPSSGPSPVASPPLTGVGRASPRTGRAGAPQQEQRRCWWGASSISQYFLRFHIRLHCRLIPTVETDVGDFDSNGCIFVVRLDAACKMGDGLNWVQFMILAWQGLEGDQKQGKGIVLFVNLWKPNFMIPDVIGMMILMILIL